jgi:hypothetical protein
MEQIDILRHAVEALELEICQQIVAKVDAPDTPPSTILRHPLSIGHG